MAAPHREGIPHHGRYLLFDEIASGGMATVHLGRLLGAAGFSRTVAIKRMHPQFAKEPEFVSMFINEARLASRIQHPNVVPTLDVISRDGELLLVMEFIQGESLAKLLRSVAEGRQLLEPALVGSIMAGVLHGLHAAHEARDDRGEPLGIIHRDVSPQNVLVGSDGVARVLDFGVAKAAMRLTTTRDGQIKGKIAYMAPEQLRAGRVDRRADVFAAGIVHWEALTGCRLFVGSDVGELTARVLSADIARPSSFAPEVSEEVDDVVMQALERDPTRRFASARDYAIAITQASPVMPAHEVGDWVRRTAGDRLRERMETIAKLERLTSEHAQPATQAPTAVVMPSNDVVSSNRSALARIRPAAALLAILALTSAAIAGVAIARRAEHSSATVSPTPPVKPVPTPAAVPPEPRIAPASTDSPPPQLDRRESKRTPNGRSVKPRNRKCDPPYTLDARGIRRVKPGCA
jgi:serine/threonine-protein kinase